MSDGWQADVRKWEEQLRQAWPGDRPELAGLLRALARQARRGRPVDRLRQKLASRLEQSSALYRQRREAVPAVQRDPQLPITAHWEEIREAIARHRVVVVCGQTGSGKSTQLPKICLELGRGVDGMIGHTQPRRLAARSIAQRLASELDCPLGQQVGYQIRFADTTSPLTCVKLMTDGILLAETQQDRLLQRYDTLIIDEVHERSLNIDFLLGYTRRLLERRDDLRLIITSATLDAQRFAQHFRTEGEEVPVLEVSGRTYPVEVRYRPPADRDEQPLGQQIADGIAELSGAGPGDILVFLPTERDIREVARVLRGRLGGPSRAEIIPLYARLSTAEQNRVFRTGPLRRIVLSTNVAESSLTVPGIRYVIDSGTARIGRYSPRYKLQRLPVEPIAQASADQRAGRCGRVAEGICIRLYSQEDYESRDRYTTPEIRRTNLASVVLKMLALGLGDIHQFPFLDPPRPDAVRDGFRTLFELGAIDDRQELTRTGRQLSLLPVDPRVGRMILAGHEEGSLAEVLVIAAGLEVQDPRDRPADKQQQADAAHSQFARGGSDFLSYLALWDFYHHLRDKLSRSQLQAACRQNFLSLRRLREWQDVHRQLRQLVQQSGMSVGPRREDYAAIHRALLTGLLSNVALRRGTFDYQGAGGTTFHLWPGSSVFHTRPDWVVAAELVETRKPYLRTVAKIDPEWIESLGAHLVKRSYHDPYWSARHGATYAREKVTLLGLPVVSGRRVPYGSCDPKLSRQLFIQHGLVEGQLRQVPKPVARNQRLVEELRQQWAKTRRSEDMVEDWAISAFYDQRLPRSVYDVPSLEKWWKSASEAQRERLGMRAEDLLPSRDERIPKGAFPDRLELDGVTVPVDYRFEPGADDDGVALTVPLEAVSRLTDGQLQWLVPGRLEEKLTALIRSLPKGIRRSLIPAPDCARKAAELLTFGEGDFWMQAARALSRLAGETVRSTDFDRGRIPDNLRPFLRVVDAQGEVVAQGRDLQQLRRLAAEQAGGGDGSRRPAAEEGDGRMDSASPCLEREGITAWDFGELPVEVEVRRGDFVLKGYPALDDRAPAAALTCADSPAEAQTMTRRGIRRLFALAHRKAIRTQVQWFPRLESLQLLAAALPGGADLPAQLGDLLAGLALGDPIPVVREAEAFERLAAEARQRLAGAAQQAASVVGPLLEGHHRVRIQWENLQGRAPKDALADIAAQLDDLTPPGFLTVTPWAWLQQYPRYFQALEARMEKLATGGAARDARLLDQLRPFVQRWRDFQRSYPEAVRRDERVGELRWMLQELRVSLFAQHLGTAVKVSPQRLEKLWADLL